MITAALLVSHWAKLNSTNHKDAEDLHKGYED